MSAQAWQRAISGHEFPSSKTGPESSTNSDSRVKHGQDHRSYHHGSFVDDGGSDSSCRCSSSSSSCSDGRGAKEKVKKLKRKLLTKESFLQPTTWCSRLSIACWNSLPCRRHDEIPVYWANVGRDIRYGLHRGDIDFFDDLYPVDLEERKLLQALLNHTNSRKEDVSFRLLRAVRIENSALWGRYNKRFSKTGAKRGRRKWAGKCPPATVGAFKDLEAVNGLTQDLDASICEAYLWHGCSPQTAVMIGHEGFCVGHQSRAGKRFGEGGYFAEDPGLADKYAGAGEGIYSDCYAMLLCRVILGRQYVTKEYKDEGITQRARRTYDSTLAEPRGSTSREFVAFRDDQIYPEYALVYERCSPQGSLRDERCRALLRPKGDEAQKLAAEDDSSSNNSDVNGSEVDTEGGEVDFDSSDDDDDSGRERRAEEAAIKAKSGGKMKQNAGTAAGAEEHCEESQAFLKEYPDYWFHADNPETFHELCPAQYMEDMLQSMLDATFARRYTSDRIDSLTGRSATHPGAIPQRLRVLKALRIESSNLWSGFQAKKLEMRREREAKEATRASKVGKVGHAKTQKHLPKHVKSRLARDLNETYLWCGSIPATIGEITSKGFTDGLFVKERGPYGPGAYFVDDSAHADEFSLDNKEGYYRGYYAMLLCRVLLGEPQYIHKALDPEAFLRIGPGQAFDSSIGKVAANEKYFREFTVRHQGQIYPEYAIIYEREYEDHRIR